MKKFYIPFFAISLLTPFMAQAQVYNSISTNNVTHYTLDDPRFWGGTLITDVPPNTCTGCTIKINSDVTVVPFNGQLAANGGVGTTSQIAGANDPSLNHITLVNSTVNLYGNTKLTVNTYLTLTNSSITLGSNPTSVETITVNDQIDFDANSGIQLANNNTVIDVNNLIGKTILGPYPEIGNNGTFKAAGLYSLFLVGGSFTQTLEANGIGSVMGQYTAPVTGDAFYDFNCSPVVVGAPHACDFGLVYGPVITQKASTANPPDPTFGVLFSQSIVLPVDLVQFLALKNEDGSINLKWATSQEINAGYFDIERSSDQSAWTKIGSVRAKGFSSITTNYSFTDKLPIDGNGYYRLKMTDLDGKFKYSKTVAVTLKADNRPLVVYNNPFSDMIRLKVNVARAQNLTITVSDMLGKSYINQSYHAQTGDNLVNLPSSISSHGVYILRIYGDSYDQTVKLQKQ